MRLFIAIELPDPLKKDVGEWTKALARAIPDPKRRLHWVKEDQFHLTLKFLGETKEDRIPALCRALRVAVNRNSHFSLRLAKAGHFGGRVIWLGTDSGTDQVIRLAEAVDETCIPLGFGREGRAYQAHITLARSKMNVGTLRMADLPPLLIQKTFRPFQVSEVSLIQSTLTPQGAVYRTLERFSLKA